MGAAAAAREDVIVSAYSRGPVIVVSDGSVRENQLGWGALVASPLGILAHTAGGVLADTPSSWAAEWVAKVEGLLLAFRVGIPVECLLWGVADNLAAAVGPNGGRPSGSAIMDELRIYYAGHRGPMTDVYTPAQHDTGWSGSLATWQAVCDSLAKGGAAAAVAWTYPCPEALGDVALSYRGGRLVLNVGATLDMVYACPWVQAAPGLQGYDGAYIAWRHLLETNMVSGAGRRLAFWLRSARHYDQGLSPCCCALYA